MITQNREILPRKIIPNHYNLTLKPNFKSFKFDGNVKIDVEVIENCERARYAQGSSINIKEDLERSSDLISKIDRQI